MFRRIAIALLLTSVFSTIAAFPAHAQTNGSTCWNYKTSERRFARKHNAERSDAGLGKLKIDPELSKIARKHTKEMLSRVSLPVDSNDLWHTSQTQVLNRLAGGWTLWGENVGYGGGVASLHTAFMNSPLHRANIMNGQFKWVGVGVIKKHGYMWVTVTFTAGSDPGTTLSMPNCN